jgi:hypothetical protein
VQNPAGLGWPCAETMDDWLAGWLDGWMAGWHREGECGMAAAAGGIVSCARVGSGNDTWPGRERRRPSFGSLALETRVWLEGDVEVQT